VSNRQVLPNRRHNETIRFVHGKQRYYGAVGYYPDPERFYLPDLKRPAEIFLDAGKPGTDIQHMARAGAVAVSLALQYGCPLKVLIDALPVLEDGTAADPLGAMLRLIAPKDEAKG
jgi:hypothetical protein